jgi:tol-pal system protein YbgF
MIMQNILVPGLVAALAASLPAPALAQSRAERQLMADIRMLQEQTQQLAITLAALNDALKAIDGRLDAQDEAARKAAADSRLVIENLGADLRVIRERTDETNVRINTLSQEMDALRNTIAQMQAAAMAAAAAGQAPADPNAPDAPLPAGAPPVAPSIPSTAGVSPTRMYETAFADYASGQWTLAISGFEAFLKTFPRAEQADDAQFYIGETHYAAGRFPDAISAYNQVIQNYPGTNAVPDAHYKRGMAQDRLGQTDDARASWELVIKQFPESDAARMAKQNLDRLSTRKPGAP